MIGSIIDGRYVLLRKIGAGGMGAVFEAQHVGTGRHVAVKLIDASRLQVQSVAIDRFHREARAAGAIDTQHIAQVFDMGTDGQTQMPYLAMELLRGEDLQQLLQRLGPLSPTLALRIVAQACLGLQKAHEAKVIHRDIKPANLFLAQRDVGEIVVKVLDFGIAKIKTDFDPTFGAIDLTRTGAMMGSPRYMSPEQMRGIKSMDHRTDIWSLGLVLYELLAGRAPFDDTEALGELMVAICCDAVDPVQKYAPWVPNALAEIVHRALQRTPSHRFETAQAMFDAIRGQLESGWSISEEELVPRTDATSPAQEKPLETSGSVPTGVTMTIAADESAVRANPSNVVVRANPSNVVVRAHEDSAADFQSSSEPMPTAAPEITSNLVMPRIKRVGTGEIFLLRSQMLLGRSPACDVRINEPRVSSEHARLRWTGSHWELRDLGSKNGTFIEERRLTTGERVTLIAGDTIGLGGSKAPAPVLQLVDGSAPVASARSTRTGMVRYAEGGFIALPDDQHPEISIVEGREGKWMVETNETARDIEENEVLTIRDDSWVLDVAGVAVSTLVVEALVLTLETITLRVVIGVDEDIDLTVVCPGKEFRLSRQKHHALLVVLARQRQRTEDLPFHERGWIDRRAVCQMLGMNDQRFNVDVMQARREFAALGIQGAVNIVERQLGTTLIRLGVAHVEVVEATA